MHANRIKQFESNVLNMLNGIRNEFDSIIDKQNSAINAQNHILRSLIHELVKKGILDDPKTNQDTSAKSDSENQFGTNGTTDQSPIGSNEQELLDSGSNSGTQDMSTDGGNIAQSDQSSIVSNT
jgi:hypothetical protein